MHCIRQQKLVGFKPCSHVTFASKINAWISGDAQAKADADNSLNQFLTFTVA